MPFGQLLTSIEQKFRRNDGLELLPLPTGHEVACGLKKHSICRKPFCKLAQMGFQRSEGLVHEVVAERISIFGQSV